MFMFGYYIQFAEERQNFSKVHSGVHEERPDLRPLALAYRRAAHLAACNVFWGFIKIFKFLQMYPSTSTLWRTLENAMPSIMPFLFVLIIVVVAFTYCANWLFGQMVEEFHTLYRAALTLVQCMGGGLPFDDMTAWTAWG